MGESHQPCDTLWLGVNMKTGQMLSTAAPLTLDSEDLQHTEGTNNTRQLRGTEQGRGGGRPNSNLRPDKGCLQKGVLRPEQKLYEIT